MKLYRHIIKNTVTFKKEQYNINTARESFIRNSGLKLVTISNGQINKLGFRKIQYYKDPMEYIVLFSIEKNKKLGNITITYYRIPELTIQNMRLEVNQHLRYFSIR